MPYYRKRRNTYRKKGYRKRYSNKISRPFGRNVNRSDGMPTKYKLRQQVGLEIPAGTVIGEFIQTWFSLTNPLYVFDSLLNAYEDWANIAGLYDYYRPTGLKIRYIPNYNMNAFTATPTNFILPIYLAHDYENIDMTSAGMVDADEMLEYENCVVKQTDKQFTHYVRVPKYNSALTADLGAITGITNAGYFPTAAPAYNGILGVGINSPFTTTDAPVSVGTIIVTMYLKAYSRK